ncbi:hypothetical protein BFW01_g2494 [Lasiodiplodia theobromae]|nr:hypothetical protein BFW01_g2494 [Lasiodiplodia theobromae]
MPQHQRVRSRTTPQPDLPHQPSTRTTRSQSRDIDIPHIKHRAQSTRRIVRGASVGSTSSVDSNTGRATRVSRTAAARTLPIVEENAVVPYPDLPEPEPEAPADVGEVTPLPPLVAFDYVAHQTPGAQSNSSDATTISTAQSVHDPNELDNDVMIEFLEDLFTDASKILEIVAPKNAPAEQLVSVASEAASPGSKTRRLVAKRGERFKEARENFGDGDFINIETVLASLVSGESFYETGTFSRPNAVLYKANVATLVKQVATLPEDRSVIYDGLLSLDNTFPRNLMDPVDYQDANAEPAGNPLIAETVSLALDIRTQFAISLLIKHEAEENFNPDELIRSVFFTVPEDDEDGAVASHLRGWEILGLGLSDDELPAFVKEAATRRVEQIRQIFQEDEDSLEQGSHINVEMLESAFPWRDFVVRVLKWASLYNVKLDNEVDSLGGVPAIQDSLKQYLETADIRSPGKRNQTASPSQRASTAKAETQSQHVPKTAAGVFKVVKRRLARLSGQKIDVAEDSGEVGTQSHVAPQVAEDEYQPPVVEDEEDEDDPRTVVNIPTEQSAMQEDLERLRQRERQNKENMQRSATESGTPARKSFYDRQSGATRVSFDEPEVSSSRNHGKRWRAETESDEEEEYETRVSNKKRKAPVEKKAQYAPSSAPARGPVNLSSAGSTRVQPRPQEESDDDDGEDDGDDAARQLKAINRQARAINSTLGTRTARGRTRWSDEEVNVLMRLIAEFGHMSQPWVRIKKADAAGDNVLWRRTNTDLKDKAINILYSYRLAGQPLPKGFEYFKLPANLEKKVNDRRGI